MFLSIGWRGRRVSGMREAGPFPGVLAMQGRPVLDRETYPSGLHPSSDARDYRSIPISLHSVSGIGRIRRFLTATAKGRGSGGTRTGGH